VVRNGDDHQLLFINDVDDVVPECPQSEFQDAAGEPFPEVGMGCNEVDCSEQILLEAIAEALPLLVEVRDRLADFLFGRSQKSRLHHLFRDRSRAKTSSADTASILPALYSA